MLLWRRAPSEETPLPSVAKAEPGTQCPKCSGVNSGSNRFLRDFAAPPRRRDSGGEADCECRGQSSTYIIITTIITIFHRNRHPVRRRERPRIRVRLFPLVKLPRTKKRIRCCVRSYRPGRSHSMRNAESLNAFYSEDALLVRPSAALVRGREEIREALALELESGLGDIRLDCSEVGVLGDLACLAGVSRMLAPIAPGNGRSAQESFSCWCGAKAMNGGCWPMSGVWIQPRAHEHFPIRKNNHTSTPSACKSRRNCGASFISTVFMPTFSAPVRFSCRSSMNTDSSGKCCVRSGAKR